MNDSNIHRAMQSVTNNIYRDKFSHAEVSVSSSRTFVKIILPNRKKEEGRQLCMVKMIIYFATIK